MLNRLGKFLSTGCSRVAFGSALRAIPEGFSLFIFSRILKSFLLFAAGMLAAALSAQRPAVEPAEPPSTQISRAAHTGADHVWWKRAVIEEIYPRSFADSNGDGVGDLNGITKHLNYMQELGIDAIWIAPMYPSPQVDFGYDISDYENIDPQYGTLEDFDRLEAAARRRGIRIILDMVLNHTSDRHRWFIESASSRENPKADWYVWNSGIPADSPSAGQFQKKNEHDGVVPPNNWESFFGGSAWEWVPARRQFYYHKFYKQQPDLNWRNPAVEAAMFDVMKFWLRRGVAGFRLDAIPELFEDAQLRNERELGGTNDQGDPNLEEVRTANQPEMHGVLRRMRAMADKFPGNRVLIGETYPPNIAVLDGWYGGAAHDELELPMDMLVGFGSDARLNAAYFRRVIREAETQLHGSQPLFVFDNHDNDRSIDRFGDGVHNVEIAKAIATILFTCRATAVTYYGAEIGMTTQTPKRKEDVKDPIGITGWPREKGRDGERTPMQWTPGPQAGFSSSPHTWLPIAPDYKTINVETESEDPSSLLNWYKKLIAIRRRNPALRSGSMVMIDSNDPNVLAFVRRSPGKGSAVVVAINMSANARAVTLRLKDLGIDSITVRTLAASETTLHAIQSLGPLTLPPFAAWVGVVQ
jgi:alpha-glucosidase